jgi:hypothetical protein
VTPSEHLWALATERANAPEHMRELFALTIDRATWEVADRINYDIGRSASFDYPLAAYWHGSAQRFYAEALHRYVQLKLRLHRVRKMLVREDIVWLDLPPCSFLADQESLLREKIKTARSEKGDAIWNIE